MGAGSLLPPLIAADSFGLETLDPKKAEQLFPIGDYKGFGIAMVVDILCSLLSGMPGGRDVSSMYGDPLSEKRFLGHFFSAIKISNFLNPTKFKSRLQGLADAVRNEPRLDKDIPVQVPGDPEKNMEKDRSKNGIPVPDYEIEQLNQLSHSLNIRPLKPISEERK
jgi:LDH2 family malate/lactate/ureidoglycolate dehydrogenase